MNYRLISSVNSATEEALPVQEKHVDSFAPKELTGNLPDFVRELQNISNNFPINC